MLVVPQASACLFKQSMVKHAEIGAMGSKQSLAAAYANGGSGPHAATFAKGGRRKFTAS